MSLNAFELQSTGRGKNFSIQYEAKRIEGEKRSFGKVISSALSTWDVLKINGMYWKDWIDEYTYNFGFRSA